jgi:signal recognition particle subunit SRP54
MFDVFSQKFSSLISRLTNTGRITHESLAQACMAIHEALLEADVPYDLADTFIASVKQELEKKQITRAYNVTDLVVKVVYDQLVVLLGGNREATFSFQLPSVVMLMGLQGAGKTTTIAKLAQYTQKQAFNRGKQRRILVGSVDFARPAAQEQLAQLAGQVGVAYYRTQETDPLRATQELFNYYKEQEYEILFLDTAGRLHVDNELLHQLRDIAALVKPRHKILILDAMTGQESLHIARAFDQTVGFQGAILTKMDSDTRGGAAFAFRAAIKKPILFMSTGEKIDDLDLFYPERVAGRIVGMGDLQSLLERADQQIKKAEQATVEKAFSSGKMTLHDFAHQLDMVSRMGFLGQLVKYMPGMGGMSLSAQMIEQGETEVKKFRAIINSMTPKERFQPALLNGTRKQRIASGAGVSVTQVNLLLDRFEQMQQYAKLIKKRRFF